MNKKRRRFDGLLLLLLAGSAAAGSAPYIPAPAPFAVVPSGPAERLAEVGLNFISLSTRWDDNFFGKKTEEVGKLRVRTYDLTAGLTRSRGERFTDEWSLIAGRVTLASITDRYHSGVINKDVDVSASGSGFDFGARYVGSYIFAKTERAAKIDWSVAWSLHAAFYRLKDNFSGVSIDGLDGNAYDATDTGLFLRPVLALEPVIDLSHRFSLQPFVGVSDTILMTYEQFSDTRFFRNGVNGRLTTDDDFHTSANNVGLMYGFDLAVPSPFDAEGSFSVGGTLNQIYGSSAGNFTEMHLIYAFPFGGPSSKSR